MAQKLRVAMVMRHEPGNETTAFIVSFPGSPNHKAGEPGNEATVFISNSPFTLPT